MSVNHCEMCSHKKNPDGGWCYMFRLEPDGPCAQHSIRALSVTAMRMQTAQRIFAEISGRFGDSPPLSPNESSHDHRRKLAFCDNFANFAIANEKARLIRED